MTLDAKHLNFKSGSTCFQFNTLSRAQVAFSLNQKNNSRYQVLTSQSAAEDQFNLVSVMASIILSGHLGYSSSLNHPTLFGTCLHLLISTSSSGAQASILKKRFPSQPTHSGPPQPNSQCYVVGPQKLEVSVFLLVHIETFVDHWLHRYEFHLAFSLSIAGVCSFFKLSLPSNHSIQHIVDT